MPIIDFHNHYYPPKYMQALQSGASSIKVTVDSEGNPVLHYPGDYNVAVRGHRDLAYRQEVLDSHGVSLQVLTLTTPGTHVESPATAVKLASLVNDEFKEAMDTRGHHFTALATLPLNDPAAAVKELDRAIAQLGMRGAMLFSNVNGVALSDRRFWPMYELANDRGAVLYIHPEHPVGVEAMMDYWLMPLVGFLSSAFRAFGGRSVISAAPFRIWPSGSIAASTRSRTAARTSSVRRAHICAISITTRSISIWPRCSSPSRSRDRNIFWRAAIIRIRSAASRRCSTRSPGCR